MIDVGTATAFLDLDISNFMQNLQKAMADTDSAANAMNTKFANQQRTIGDKMLEVGNTIVSAGQRITSAFAGVTTAVDASVNTALDFYSSMDKVKSVMRTSADWTDEAYDKMAEAARQWGKTTIYNAEDAADALYYMGLAGWGTEESIAALGPVLKLAAAGDMELGRTSDIVTDAMNALHLAADDTSEGLNSAEWFTAILAATMANSNTTVDMLGESFRYVASTVGALENPMYSAEQASKDLAFMLGLEADAGIKAAQGGTSLRRVLLNLLNPQKQAQQGLKNLNLSMEDVDISTKGVKGTMDMFRDIVRSTLPYLDETAIAHLEVAEGLSEEEAEMQLYNKTQDLVTQGIIDMNQQQVLMNLAKISGVTAVSAFLAILTREQDEYDALYDVINNATESQLGYNTVLDDMYDDMTKTKGPVIEFKSALNELAIEFGENLLPTITKFIQSLTDIVRAFGSLPEPVQSAIMHIGLFLAALGPVVTTIGRVVQAVSWLVKGVQGFIDIAGNVASGVASVGTAIGGVVSTIAGIASAIGGAITSVWSFVTMWQDGWDIIHGILLALGAAISAVGAVILGAPAAVAAVVAAIVAAVGNLAIVVKDHFNEIVSFLGDVVNSIGDYLSGLFSFIGDILGSIWDTITSLFGNIDGALSSLMSAIGGALSSVFSTISSFFSSLMSTVEGVLGNIWSILTNLFQGVISSLQNVWDVVTQFISNIASNVADMFSGIVQMFAGLISDIGNGISEIFNNIANFFSQVISFVANLFSDIVGAFSNLISTISSALSGLFDWIANFFNNIINTVTNFFNEAVSFIVNSIGKIWDLVSQLFGNVIKGMQELFSNIVKTVGEIFANVLKIVGDGIANIGEWIVNGFKKVVEVVSNIGTDIVEGLWNGITAAAGWLYDKVAGFARGVIDTMKSALGISSPSKVMRDEVGVFLPAGIALGFEKSMPGAINDMQDSLDTGISKLQDNVDDVDVDINASTDVQANDISQNIMNVFSVFNNYIHSVEDSISASIDRMTEKLATFMDYSQYVMNDDGTAALRYISYTPFNNANNATEYDNMSNAIASSGGGDTIIIQSPRPIDELEAARQIKKVKQELQEGL